MQAQTHTALMRAYEPIHAAFMRYCSSQAYGIMDAEDLVQEALLAALQRWHRIRDKDNLMRYLVGIVNNVVNKKRRRARFRGTLEEAHFEQLADQAPSSDVALDIHFLLRAMNKLPEKQQEALRLFDICGFSIREISHLQGSSESATKTRLSRARKRLRELLSEEGKTMSIADRLAIYASIML